MTFRQGQVYFVYLDPVFGRELGGYKTRPVVVLSVDEIHRDQRLVISIIPGTSDKGKFDPGRERNIVLVGPEPKVNGLKFPTLFMCHQMRALDRGRFTSSPVGSLRDADIARLKAAVKYCLGIL